MAYPSNFNIPTPPPAPSPTLDELERVLGLIVNEQRRLLDLLKRHRVSMSKLDADETARLSAEQESVRTRLSSIDGRRKALSLQAARELRVVLPANSLPTLTQLAGAMTDKARQARFVAVRDELRGLLHEVAAASHIASKIAGGVLGHLNTALRLLSSAMRDAGTYTKSGAPRVGPRLGNLEAVG